MAKYKKILGVDTDATKSFSPLKITERFSALSHVLLKVKLKVL